MIKFVSSILVILLSASCTSQTTAGDVNTSESNVSQPTTTPLVKEKGAKEKGVKETVAKAIALAQQNKDYRLLVTSGRSISIPGVKSSEYQTVIALCGKKYNPATGDVITSEAQRIARRKHIDFMRQYNEQMLVICQENSMK